MFKDTGTVLEHLHMYSEYYRIFFSAAEQGSNQTEAGL